LEEKVIEGLIGKKIGMTQVFDEDGNAIPVTIIKAGPCLVVQKKIEEKDGYKAVQLGFVEEKPVKKIKKPLEGHFKKANVQPARKLKEFYYDKDENIEVGKEISLDIFEGCDRVNVTGISKGKGFAGVIKRWGFKGGKGSHGSMFHRAPGSIGASTFPARVIKGKKLPGRKGGEKITVRNLKIVKMDKENHLLIVKGAVPGANGSYVYIKRSDFKKSEG
jgi:large subunit ribosomal protein L3